MDQKLDLFANQDNRSGFEVSIEISEESSITSGEQSSNISGIFT